MIISKIERQKKDKERYSLFVEDKFLIGVSKAILIHFALYKGQQISEDLLVEIKEAEYNHKVYNKAIHYLSFGLRTVKEMRDYLAEIPAFNSEEAQSNSEDSQEKSVIDETLIQSVIQRLSDQNYLNDLIYGQSYVRTHALINRKGPRLIKQELLNKGLTEATILTALEEYPEDQQVENLFYLGEKFIRTKKSFPPKMLRNKLQEYLLKKGFNRDLVQTSLTEFSFEDAEEQENDLLKKTAEKLLRTRQRKYSGYDLQNKMKESLYRKGFDFEAINQWIADHSALFE